MHEEHEKMKDNWKIFEEELSKKTSPGDRGTELTSRVTLKNDELIKLFEN